MLLAEAKRVARSGVPVTLLAPFAAFPVEEGLGGRVARSQVRYLARWVRRERKAALMDFYVRAGLDVEPGMADGIAAETLAAGLVRLEQGRVEGPVPDGWRMLAGAQDGLLNAVELKGRWPALVVVAGATHHPAALLRAWKEEGI